MVPVHEDLLTMYHKYRKGYERYLKWVSHHLAIRFISLSKLQEKQQDDDQDTTN